MSIKSEWELISSIKDLVNKKGLSATNDLLESIGDDCSVFRLTDNRYGLITTDISIDSIHFNKDIINLEDIGFKAMMGNISDVTAMGGHSKFAFISLGIPEGFSKEKVLAIYEGLLEAANMADVRIAGGDTSKAKELIVNISLYGEVAGNRLTLRNGANAGDKIYVTGNTGDAMAGLEILLSSKSEKEKQRPCLINKHKRPIARYHAIDEILNIFNPSSMIDVSDSLLSDLRHICDSSGTGFEIDEEKLPVSRELIEYCSSNKKSQYEYAMKSGEEYELLFTSGKELPPTITMNINGIQITLIGEIIEGGFFTIKNNAKQKISIAGFDHFESSSTI